MLGAAQPIGEHISPEENVFPLSHKGRGAGGEGIHRWSFEPAGVSTAVMTTVSPSRR